MHEVERISSFEGAFFRIQKKQYFLDVFSCDLELSLNLQRALYFKDVFFKLFKIKELKGILIPRRKKIIRNFDK